MKKIFRRFLFNIFIIYVLCLIIPGFGYSRDIYNLFFAGLVFTLINIFIRPILKILILPLNFLSLNLFSFILNAVLLYLLTIFVPQITVTAFTFSGFKFQGFSIPEFHFNIYFAFIIISFFYSLSFSFLQWLCSKN